MTEPSEPGNPPLWMIRYEQPAPPTPDEIQGVLGATVHQLNAPGDPHYIAVLVTAPPTPEQLKQLDDLMSLHVYARTRYVELPRPKDMGP